MLNLTLINFGVIKFFVDLGPSPVSWTVVPRFNRIGIYLPENSLVVLLGGLLTLDLFIIVIEKLPLSLHDYYGIK